MKGGVDGDVLAHPPAIPCHDRVVEFAHDGLRLDWRRPFYAFEGRRCDHCGASIRPERGHPTRFGRHDRNAGSECRRRDNTFRVEAMNLRTVLWIEPDHPPIGQRDIRHVVDEP